MLITVDRYKSNADATLSAVAVDGSFMCFGLEDEARAVKVKGETRIPAGTYNVTLRTEGGWHKRFSEQEWIKDLHVGMLWVRDVPGFEYILIHTGNTDEDTAGCLIVGERADGEHMRVLNSRFAYRRLYAKVSPAAEKGLLKIECRDKDKGEFGQ